MARPLVSRPSRRPSLRLSAPGLARSHMKRACRRASAAWLRSASVPRRAGTLAALAAVPCPCMQMEIDESNGSEQASLVFGQVPWQVQVRL